MELVRGVDFFCCVDDRRHRMVHVALSTNHTQTSPKTTPVNVAASPLDELCAVTVWGAASFVGGCGGSTAFHVPAGPTRAWTVEFMTGWRSFVTVTDTVSPGGAYPHNVAPFAPACNTMSFPYCRANLKTAPGWPPSFATATPTP
eukprot:m.166222 g.166222  ORF g.166222 m.166222 type:complete len:145 (+) comp24034_c0_seq3:1406-1840(+)